MAEEKKKYKYKNFNENSLKPLKENQIRLNDREDFIDICSKGGKARVKQKREVRHAKEILSQLLAEDLPKEEVIQILGKDSKDRNTYSVMIQKMLQVANSGNVKAFAELRDTFGDKPTEAVNLTANVITDKDRQLLALLADKMQEKG